MEAIMPQTDTLINWGPLVIIAVAIIWGVGRIGYLGWANGVVVASFLTNKKTGPEIGLGTIAVILDAYLILRPFSLGIDDLVWAQVSPVPIFGLIIMALGIGLMIVCQIDMGKAWRIGVPETAEDSQSLVTSGIYAYSRNPIYVAILMFIVGSAVMLPGPLTILSAIGTFLLMRPLIHREETFLSSTFGDTYRHYQKHVRRWI